MVNEMSSDQSSNTSIRQDNYIFEIIIDQLVNTNIEKLCYFCLASKFCIITDFEWTYQRWFPWQRARFWGDLGDIERADRWTRLVEDLNVEVDRVWSFGVLQGEGISTEIFDFGFPAGQNDFIAEHFNLDSSVIDNWNTVLNRKMI